MCIYIYINKHYLCLSVYIYMSMYVIVCMYICIMSHKYVDNYHYIYISLCACLDYAGEHIPLEVRVLIRFLVRGWASQARNRNQSKQFRCSTQRNSNLQPVVTSMWFQSQRLNLEAVQRMSRKEPSSKSMHLGYLRTITCYNGCKLNRDGFFTIPPIW